MVNCQIWVMYPTRYKACAVEANFPSLDGCFYMDFCLVYSSVGLGGQFVSLGGCEVVEPRWLSDCWPRWPVIASLRGCEIVGFGGQLLPALVAV